MKPNVVLAEWPAGRRTEAIHIGFDSRTIHFRHRHVRMQPMPFLFSAALIAASPQPISHDEMIAFLWDGDEGGPMTAVNCLYVMAVEARRRCAMLGILIETRWSYGWVAVLPDVAAIEAVAA